MDHARHVHGGKGSGKFVNVRKVIGALLQKDDFFLDVGCGPGDYLLEAVDITPNSTGIDTHKESIIHVNGLGIKGILADATKTIPFKKAQFDAVLLSNVLHGFVAENTQQRALSEIRRVLKDTGRLGIIEFKKNSVLGPQKNIRISELELVTILRDNGFVKIKKLDVGPYNYMVIFTKLEE